MSRRAYLGLEVTTRNRWLLVDAVAGEVFLVCPPVVNACKSGLVAYMAMLTAFLLAVG